MGKAIQVTDNKVLGISWVGIPVMIPVPICLFMKENLKLNFSLQYQTITKKKN